MSLRSFLDDIERQGQVIHIADKVSPKFETSSILNAFPDGPVFLFENVEGYKVNVVGNVCSTRERICRAFGIQSEGLYQKLNDALRYPKTPRIVEDAPVKEVEEAPNLSKIPILTHFERDAGPYITSGIIAARSIDGKVENVSIHRLQVLDNKRLAIRLVPRQLYKLWNMAKEQKKLVDIAISMGVHPAILLAAACSPPLGVSEYGVANRLLGGELRLVKCPNVNAYAPAEAELVLEGRISVSEEVKEGPFVDITGTYDIQRMQPIVEVVNVMHRKNYLYQALMPGSPEHRLLMGLPREVSIYEVVSQVVPHVEAVNLSIGGCGWLHAVISIDKQKDGDAKNALMAALVGHPSLKHAVVVDSDIDIFNPEEVEWAVALRFQAGEDLVVIPNARGSTLDPSGDQEGGLTSKMGIDATRPLSVPKENFEKAKVPATKKATRIIEKLAGTVKK
jgi:2,5-furandicarboxylate decarboxylase 1